MFICEGKPLSFLEFNLEPTTFEGGKLVYYVDSEVILHTTIVAGYRSNAMFQEGRYGITNTGEEIRYPMEMVDWNFKLVSEYLTEKYPKLFTLSENCLMTMNVPPGQEFQTVATDCTDGVRLSEDRFIKYEALRVEHLDELAKLVESIMESKEESTESPASKNECFIRSESTPTDRQLNKYYVRFHYIDDNGKENKFNLLVSWDANSLLKLDSDLRKYFNIEQRLFMEIDGINLVEIAGK